MSLQHGAPYGTLDHVTGPRTSKHAVDREINIDEASDIISRRYVPDSWAFSSIVVVVSLLGLRKSRVSKKYIVWACRAIFPSEWAVTSDDVYRIEWVNDETNVE